MKTLRVNLPVLKILGGASVTELLEHAMQELPPDLVPNIDTSPEPTDAVTVPSAGQLTPPGFESDSSSSSRSTSGVDDPVAEEARSSSSASSLDESRHESKPAAAAASEPTIQRSEPLSFGQSMF